MHAHKASTFKEGKKNFFVVVRSLRSNAKKRAHFEKIHRTASGSARSLGGSRQAKEVIFYMTYPMNPTGFITHTFSECVENHAGMEMLGEKRAAGFAVSKLRSIAARVQAGEVVELGGHGADEACVLVVRNGINMLLKDPHGADKLLAESVSKPFDSTFLNVKRQLVQNKHGRYNNCYAEAAQEPDIPKGKGTVVAFGDAPVMAQLRAKLPELLGEEAKDLFAETNYYMDVTDKRVGIGWHGVSCCTLQLAPFYFYSLFLVLFTGH